MKKVLMFASAAIAALAMVSCNKEIETPESLAGEVCPDGYYIEELEATYPVDPATRTAFNETSGKFAWTEGDELAFHLSNGTYTSAPIDPATSKVKLYLPVGVTRDNYAVYPASAVVEEAATVGNMQVTLPSTYDISGNLETEFVPMPLIATNDAENKNLKFEHVGALLQVNLNVPAGVKTAKLSMGKTITGTFDLAAGSGNGVIEAGAASDDALTFVLSEEGLADATTVKLLAPLPSGTYEKFEVVYDSGFAFTKDLSANPWVFDRTQGKKVSIAEDSFEDPTDYFFIEALEAGSTVKLVAYGQNGNYPTKVALKYSLDGKLTWNDWDWDNNTLTLENVGDRVYFYGTEGRFSSMAFNMGYANPQAFNVFQGTGKLKTGGMLQSLLGRDCPEMTTDYCFTGLFYSNTALVDASELVFPNNWTTGCYRNMFYDCGQLVNGPLSIGEPESVPDYACYSMFYQCYKLKNTFELPAMSVGKSAYSNMFYRCSSLTAAPYLPATSLSTSCYSHMFEGCTKIASCQDVLPAMDLYASCYYAMFSICTALKTPPVLPATVMAKNCYGDMFSSSGIESIPELSSISLAESCYSYMFDDCDNLVDLSSDVLPALEVPSSAYSNMFRYCGNLTHAPQILAESFTGERNMEAMFAACNNLVSFPSELKPEVIPSKGYYQMFAGCTALSSPMVIKAKDITASQCLMYMLCGCNALSSIEVHFENWGTEVSSTNYWVSNDTYNTMGSSRHKSSGVAAEGSFYKPENLELKQQRVNYADEANYIPAGWTVYNLNEVGAGL